MRFTKDLVAPCGLNCGVCFEYLREDKKCNGCTSTDNIHTSRGIKCGIKYCSQRKTTEYAYCYQCSKFPCQRLKSTDKRYIEKHKVSLISNLNEIKQDGINAFLKNEEEKWRCKNCGETLCVHRSFCLHCNIEYR